MKPIESRYKIAPCPFCGYAGELFSPSSEHYFIRCSNKSCHAEQNVYLTEEVAVARWNRRIDKSAEIKLEEGEDDPIQALENQYKEYFVKAGGKLIGKN